MNAAVSTSERRSLNPSRGSRGRTSALQDAQRQALADALASHQGDRRELASHLGISLRTLYRKLRELDADA